MPAARRRTSTKLFRLLAEEFADIAARAEACGLKPAGFIRETTLGAIPGAGLAKPTRAVLDGHRAPVRQMVDPRRRGASGLRTGAVEDAEGAS